MNKIQVHGGVEEAAEMARDARFYTLSMLLSMWKASPSLILRQELIRQVTFCVENSPICVCSYFVSYYQTKVVYEWIEGSLFSQVCKPFSRVWKNRWEYIYSIKRAIR